MQALLESGSDVDASDANKMTALLFASYFGHLHVVKVTSNEGLCVCLMVRATGSLEAQCEHGGFHPEGIHLASYCCT